MSEPIINESEQETQKRIWDIPVRLFHWSVLILVAVSIYTGETGGFKEMDYHMLAGYCILALVLFRVIWGFVGTFHARFTNFLKPGLIPGYIKHFNQTEKPASAGHNPLGALSVCALLICLLVQAGTGLFANDDIFLEGPLTHLVDDEMSDQLTSIHHLNVKVLYGLIALHVIAILFYELRRAERLCLAMLHGRKTGTQGPHVELAPGREIVTAIVTISTTAGAVYWLINYA